MGSQWTSKYAILRDLSFAQGRKVPAAIVGIGQKPPTIEIIEDTEEEFFQNCVAEGAVYSKPDLSLIQQMINMVKENDPANDDDVDMEKGVEISKLNPLSEEFIPKGEGNDEKKEKTDKTMNKQNNSNDIEVKINHVKPKQEAKPQKKRRERNAAIISLLEKEKFSPIPTQGNNRISPLMDQFTIEIPETNNINSEVKLLKPNDFIIDTNVTKAVEKVKEWLHKPIEPQVEKTKSINMSHKNMFKKKTPAASLNLDNTTSMFKRKSDASSIKSSDSDTVPKTRPSDSVFVPSTHANEYYKKYAERVQVQEMAQEDIWKRTERLMKEIDAKRLKEKEKRIDELHNSSSEMNVELKGILNNDRLTLSIPLNISGLEKSSVRLSILLPQHRHDLPEECKVCYALAKYKRKQESAQ